MICLKSPKSSEFALKKKTVVKNHYGFFHYVLPTIQLNFKNSEKLKIVTPPVGFEPASTGV